MIRHRLLTIAAATTAALGLSSTAIAASGAGVVLSADSHRHVVQIVDAQHVVHAYRDRRLHGVQRGSRVTFAVGRAGINHVRVVGRLARVSFLARVLSEGARGLTVRLADGHRLGLTRRRLKTVDGLQRGEDVLITDPTRDSAAVTITIPITPSPAGATVGAHQAAGVITRVDTDSFRVKTGAASPMLFHLAAGRPSDLNLSVCDNVTLSYHQDAGVLIADRVTDTGPSTSGACSTGGAGQNDLLGAITAVSDTGITIDSGDQVSTTFTVSDPSITSGLLAGDSVDVTYEQAGGALLADDVQYNDQPTSGVVTGAGAGTVTIVDDDTGNSATFAADPSLLDGVQIGDEVVVSYHQAATGQTLDQLTDDGASTGGGSDS